MTIQAIETIYKGYRFRSRLEARWAVFFDALGIDWEYEPEGYKLSDGTRYLPDFWIPCPVYHRSVWGTDRSGYFIEIKPSGEPTADAKRRAKSLAKESGHTTFIFAGDPAEYIFYEYGRGGYQNIGVDKTYSPMRRFSLGQNKQVGLLWCLRHAPQAAEKARSARFERGR